MEARNTESESGRQAMIRLNILNLLKDTLDSAMSDTRKFLMQNGQDLVFSDKKAYNQAMDGLNKFLNYDGTIKKEEGVSMINDKCKEADRIYQFILMLVDRVGEEDEMLFRFYDYIKSFPSKVSLKGLSEGEKLAFEKMFTKKHRVHGLDNVRPDEAHEQALRL